ncbi:transposase [uncultured Paraglaciecola sp.]|uniref:transposase n=1 Tax=uncultured Paraglaciecola sp. TaxID=1765024 RepID=UPI0025F82E22|nr:transposase [uncultured Paraglaciecola sp.]
MQTARTKDFYLANHCTYRRIKANDRLCRYITRSEVSEERLAITTYGKIRYPLKISYSSCRDRHPNLLKLRFLAPKSI